MGDDAIRAGRGDYRAWLEMQVQAYPPNQATVSSPQEVLFTARLAQVSEKDYSNTLRKSYMQSADFSVKPQQLNRLQRNARETASDAGPQVPVTAIGAAKTQQGWRESIVNVLWKITNGS